MHLWCSGDRQGWRPDLPRARACHTWGKEGESPSLTTQAVEAGPSKLTEAGQLVQSRKWFKKCKWLLTNWLAFRF